MLKLLETLIRKAPFLLTEKLAEYFINTSLSNKNAKTKRKELHKEFILAGKLLNNSIEIQKLYYDLVEEIFVTKSNDIRELIKELEIQLDNSLTTTQQEQIKFKSKDDRTISELLFNKINTEILINQEIFNISLPKLSDLSTKFKQTIKLSFEELVRNINLDIKNYIDFLNNRRIRFDETKLKKPINNILRTINQLLEIILNTDISETEEIRKHAEQLDNLFSNLQQVEFAQTSKQFPKIVDGIKKAFKHNFDLLFRKLEESESNSPQKVMPNMTFKSADELTSYIGIYTTNKYIPFLMWQLYNSMKRYNNYYKELFLNSLHEHYGEDFEQLYELEYKIYKNTLWKNALKTGLTKLESSRNFFTKSIAISEVIIDKKNMLSYILIFEKRLSSFRSLCKFYFDFKRNVPINNIKFSLLNLEEEIQKLEKQYDTDFMHKTTSFVTRFLSKSQYYLYAKQYIDSADALSAKTNIPILREKLDETSKFVSGLFLSASVFAVDAYQAKSFGFSYTMLNTASRFILSDIIKTTSLAERLGLTKKQFKHFDLIFKDIANHMIFLLYNLITKDLELNPMLYIFGSFFLSNRISSLTGHTLDMLTGNTIPESNPNKIYGIAKQILLILSYRFGSKIWKNTYPLFFIPTAEKMLSNQEECAKYSMLCREIACNRLSLNSDCTIEEANPRFRELALNYHPDKKTGDTDKFRFFNVAVKALRNLEKNNP